MQKQKLPLLYQNLEVQFEPAAQLQVPMSKRKLQSADLITLKTHFVGVVYANEKNSTSTLNAH